MNSKRRLLEGAPGTELNRRGVDTGLPTWVSFVCDESGRILSGESLTDAAEKLLTLGVKTSGVNFMPTHTIAPTRKDIHLNLF